MNVSRMLQTQPKAGGPLRTSAGFRWGRLARMSPVVLVLAVGCAGTRVPDIRPSPPAAERREFEYFYPYAEESAGPPIFANPGGYELPRSEATRLQRYRPRP